jgi:eukaryotic-like serine/threonine-protein kinase
MFRANSQRTGVYNATGVRQFKEIKWQFQNDLLIPASDWNQLLFGSTLELADGLLYLAGKNRFHVINAETGKELWVFPLETGKISDLIFNNGIIYLVSVSNSGNYICAVDIQTRQQKWRSQHEFSIDTSILIVENLLFFGSKNGNVYALNSETGEVIWQFQTIENTLVTSLAFDSGVIYCGSKNGMLYAIEARTGEQKWKTYIGLLELPFSSPIVADKIIYIETKNSIFHAINSETGAEIWQIQLKFKDALFKSREKDNLLLPFLAPAIHNGVAYIGGVFGYICAIDLQAQQQIWYKKTELTKFSGINLILNNLIIADEVVYHWVPGTIEALDANTGQQLWQFAIPTPEYSSIWQMPLEPLFMGFQLWNLGTKLFTGTPFIPISQPIITDGVIYLNCGNGYLYALH